MFRLRTLALAALVAAACTSAESTSVLTINLPADGRKVAVGGAPVKFTVWGRTVSGDGATTTPAKGIQVTLSVDDANQGTVTPATLTLGDDGKGEGTFTVGSAAVSTKAAIIKATATIDTKALNATTSIQITSGAKCEVVDCAVPECGTKACTKDGVPGTCNATLKVCETGTETAGDFSLAVQLLGDEGGQRKFNRALVGGVPFGITATLTNTKEAKPAADQDITFKVEGIIGKIGKSADDTAPADTVTVKTGAAGTATAAFFPGTEPANGKIIVSYGADLKVTTIFDIVIPGTLTFEQPEDPAFGIMGVKTSGYREQQVLKFKLLDSSGEPYQGAANVKFSIVTTGGASFAPAEATTDGNGEVAVTVYSGTSAGTLAVAATTKVGSRQISTTSPSIAVVGAKASGRNFAVRCETVSIPSLIGNDCSFMRTSQTVKCTAVAGDRFNNLLGVGGHATWHTEGGLFGPPSSFPTADPTSEPASQEALGHTENLLTTLNTRLPRDVPPLADEPSLPADPSAPCVALDGSPRVHNPRDGLDTFIVTTQGEEGFYDTNGNGVYDVGENYLDIGEPYVDSNDNNVWDTDEVFIDVNKNNTYDGPNKQWDADTTVWATGHVMMTGDCARAVPNVSQPAPAPDVYIAPNPVAPKGVARWSLRWMDENLNAPAPTFTTYSVKIIGKGAATQVSPDHYVDHFGSIGVAQVTICDAATKICRMETRISNTKFPGDPESGQYTAPDESTVDDIIPQCSVAGAGGAVKAEIDFPVTVR